MMKVNIVLFFLLHAMILPSLHAQDKIDMLMFEKQYDEALQLLDSQIEENPTVLSYLRKGSVLSMLHDYQAAVKAYAEGLKMEPGNLQITAELADAYAALGNHHEATSYYEHAVNLDPQNLLLAGKLGRNYIQQNDYRKAYHVLYDVCSKDSTKVIWNKQLAYCAYQTGRISEAIRLFDRVIEMNPGDYSSYMNLIKIFQQTNQDKEMLSVAEKGLTQFPNDAGFLLIKAAHSFSIRNYEAAKLEYEKYFTAGGDSTYRTMLNYGISLYFNDDAEKAVPILDECASQVANDPYVLFYLGLAHKKLIHFDVAELYMKAAIESATPAYLSDMYHHLGQIYGQQRMFEESVAALKKANELDPENYEVLFEIATTYEEFNSNKTLALNYYNIYLREAGESARNADYALERMSRIKEDLFFEE